jgi:hypothetical protein
MKRTRIPISILAALGCVGCLSVEDQTPSPAQYSTSAPPGFPVKARAVATWASSPTLRTAVLLGTPATYEYSTNVPMTRNTVDQDLFEGVFTPGLPGVRAFVACGFRVQHAGHSNLLGFIPKTVIVTKDVAGNPYAEYVAVGSISGLTIGASFPTGGGGTIKTGPLTVPTYTSYWSISLLNFYKAGLTVTNAGVTCGNGQACDSFSPPYIGAISTTTLPVTLACTDFATVFFQCADDAVSNQRGGEAKFETSLGTVLVPFICGQEYGA